MRCYSFSLIMLVGFCFCAHAEPRHGVEQFTQNVEQPVELEPFPENENPFLDKKHNKNKYLDRSTASIKTKTALAMIGKPQLPADFTHFPYVNPHAPKGGKLTFGVVGTFDGLNPFVIRNFRTTARGLFADQQFGSLVYETMMARSYDEPFSLYGLLAERVEMNEERTSITFHLHPKARFADNQPVTVEDVLFSYQLLRDYARPPYSNYMKQVRHLEKLDTRIVRFHFDETTNRELALLIAVSMPILPHHSVDIANFAKNDLTPILGSGPYRIEKVETGRRIIYRRNVDYWGADLPVNRGLYNFDTIEIHYYRNDNARFEAFKKGMLDIFLEDNPNRWQRGYDFIGMREGHVVKETFTTGLPAPMVGFVFNSRRPIFTDRRVRKALSLLVDFEWLNRNLYHNAYRRTQGFWDGSELSSLNRPANAREYALLAPFLSSIEPAILEGSWQIPTSDSSGFERQNAAKAYELLYEAGFRRQADKLLTPQGQPLRFELLITRAEDEKLALAYARSLARLGIELQVRQVDDSQYQNRLGNFDYDMIIGRLSASLSPGTEQRNRWSSQASDIQGSFNFAGVREAAIDKILQTLLNVRSTEDFVASVRALDRLLISGFYYIPLYHIPGQNVARWSHINHPHRPLLYGYRLNAWWHEKPL